MMRAEIEKGRTRVIVALALAESYDSCEDFIPGLEALCADCTPELVEETSRKLVGSTEPQIQAICFLLQSAVQQDACEPDPIEWRELAPRPERDPDLSNGPDVFPSPSNGSRNGFCQKAGDVAFVPSRSETTRRARNRSESDERF